MTIHVTLRKQLDSFDSHGRPVYVYFALYTQFRREGSSWIPADASGALSFNMDCYKDTLPLTDSIEDGCERSLLMQFARTMLQKTLTHNAIAFNQETIRGADFVFHDELPTEEAL